MTNKNDGEQNCGCCRFFGSQTVCEISEMGARDFTLPACRKNAPKIFLKTKQGIFPTMTKDEWCGEYEAEILETKNV